MNLLTLYFGSIGTAKVKRFRRGMEKAWNRAYEPLQKIWSGYPKKDKKQRGKFLKKKYKYVE